MPRSARPGRSHALAASILAALSCAGLGCSSAEKVPAQPPSSSGATSCAAASLSLPADHVVGTLDGKPILVKDLGTDAETAEKRSLHEYCDAVYAARNDALDGYVTRELVRKAATAAGVPEDMWLRAEVDKRNPRPSDEQVRAFYEERKRPDAPPLELVKDQVVQAMQSEQAERVAREVINELRAKAAITRAFPDVRSPPRDVTLAAHTARKGGTGDKVRVVEFADFQCPYCSMAAATVKELSARYGDKVEFAYRHFPLRSIHPDAQRAGEYAQCAQEQGRFWEMHDRLYADQQNLGEDALKKAATDVGLDAAKLEACIASGRGTTQVNDDYAKGEELGVRGTPSFFINGRQHNGPATPEGLAAVIDAELSR